MHANRIQNDDFLLLFVQISWISHRALRIWSVHEIFDFKVKTWTILASAIWFFQFFETNSVVKCQFLLLFVSIIDHLGLLTKKPFSTNVSRKSSKNWKKYFFLKNTKQISQNQLFFKHNCSYVLSSKIMVGFQNNGWPDGIPRSQMLFLHRNIAKNTSRHAYMSILDDFLMKMLIYACRQAFLLNLIIFAIQFLVILFPSRE